MSVGKVYLVGAGPGDPGLLTISGQRCLQVADVVLYDSLVNPLLLRHTRANAEIINRAASKSRAKLGQEDLNQLLIDRAMQGQTVVRLKGGDPGIFGRGTEEATALRKAGIDFEIVPGVTAATAAAQYAGISVTHRQFASAVAFITGHEDPAKPEMLDYSALAKFPGTLVFYMGLGKLKAITGALIECGKAAYTPACVISRASTTRQQSVQATLAEIATVATQANLSAPSIVIVGDCVNQREALRWFEQKPLFGRRIGITRAADQMEPTVAQVLQLGGEPVPMPLIEIEATNPEGFDSSRLVAGEFAWLAFTSVNGVRFFFDWLKRCDLDARSLGAIKLATVGTKTAAALADFQLRADLIPETENAESLAEALLAAEANGPILWATGSRSRDVLPERIPNLQRVEVYRTTDLPLAVEVVEQITTGDIDWIGVSSPAIAQNLAGNVSLPASVKTAAISALTADAAREAGMTVEVTAATASWDGIIEGIVNRETNR